MPLRYRQCDDVLPQPPPSGPFSQTVQEPELSSDVNSINTPPRTPPSSPAPPFCTARNVFGLVRQFFSSTPPSHDPEEVVTLQDISSIPANTPAELDIAVKPPDISYHPYPNRSSFELGHCTHWDQINSQLGASIHEERDEWEDEDVGWRKTEVTIEVPFSQTTAQPGARSYIATDLYHQSLVSVIREKLSNAQDDKFFHYEPYHL
ncbi:hypothetical protein CY34DRAFT_19956 [Suillus luteus UH-Slu-Lm8-n1]|uniref:Uncharacterized protein n=1 Tax=Suillus luteus UH-Slu-Lm8-n1 TaxID=930992 RepID=A0A0C9Z1N2_9AGAM|nr:hypothetical protein CY34DRAFT_19956 [Suillus luteus UH-Slu-Lm8-n1]